MTEQKKTRRQKLEEFLAQNPSDAFSRYGIALECVREGDLAAADVHFRAIRCMRRPWRKTVAARTRKQSSSRVFKPPFVRGTSTPVQKWKAFFKRCRRRAAVRFAFMVLLIPQKLALSRMKQLRDGLIALPENSPWKSRTFRRSFKFCAST